MMCVFYRATQPFLDSKTLLISAGVSAKEQEFKRSKVAFLGYYGRCLHHARARHRRTGAFAGVAEVVVVVGRVVEVEVLVAVILVRPEHARPLPDESHSPGVEGALQAGARRLQVRVTHQLRDGAREELLLPPDLLLVAAALVPWLPDGKI